MKDQDKSRQQLLEELAQLRERLAAAQANSPGAVRPDDAPQESDSWYRSFLRDFKGIVFRGKFGFQPILLAGAVEEITGYARHEFLAGSVRIDRLMHPDDLATMQGMMEPVRTVPGYSTEWEYRIVRKDGETRWVREVIHNICEEGRTPTAVQGILYDITRFKQAEDALRESEQRYRSLAESTTDFVYILDREGTLLYANRSAAECVGSSPSALVGKGQHDLFPPEVAKRHVERTRRVFETGEPGETDELLRFGPQEIWLNVRSIPLRDEQGRVASVMGVCRNVTDRKQAETALQKAHDELEETVRRRAAELLKANEQLAMFRRFAEASAQGFGMADLEGHLTYANPALARLYGEARPEDVLGKHVCTYYREGYRARREAEMLPALKREGHWQGEETLCSRSGRQVSVLQNTFLIRDENGNPLRLASVLTDITERKQAEESLRLSEEKYRALVERSPDAVVMADLEGRITFVSQRILELHGSDRIEAFLGKTALDFVAEEDHPKFLEYFRRTLEGVVTRDTEYTLVRKDGTRFPGEISAALIRDLYGKPAALVALVRDVTGRRQAEETLRQSHGELQAIYDGLVDGLVVADAETCGFLRANTAMCRMLGYSEAELLSRSVRDIHPAKDLPAVLEEFRGHAEGRIHLSESLPVLRSDGSVFYADVVSNTLTFNRRRCVLAFFRDITERRRAHAALERERKTLKHLLQSSDHERQLIAYEIHDGLAQQLAGAIMQFDTYSHQKDRKPRLAAKAFDAGLTMLRQGHKEARRLISGVRPPILDEAGIVAAVSHLVNEERRRRGPKIEFLSKVEFERLTPILENAVYRIVQEALANACRHSKSKLVRVELVQQGDQVHIEVEDHGAGFRPEDISESHFGVAGIRERARLLGGSAVLYTEPGKGTRIAVDLPIVLRREEDE